jgi:predicted MPP superfamily phosphohydrolase
MRTTTGIIIFIGIFAIITISINYYIFVRGLQAIPQGSSLRNAYTIAFWFVALSFLGGRLLESRIPSALADFFIWTGSIWLAAMVYFFLAVVFLDILRLINHFVPFYPAFIKDHYSQFKYILAASITGAVGVTLLVGHIISVMPKVKTIDLSISKRAAGLHSLNIAMVSDIHLGKIIGRSRFDEIVNRINQLNPDMVLLPGDIVDEDLAPVINQNLGEALKAIRSRFGVYAITGNHEYIGGVEEACSYIENHGIAMLRDETRKIGNSFFLVGREDRSANRFPGWHEKRKPLSELMKAVDKSYPVLLMDHQPFELEEAAQQGVDLQISGHTHNGQLWPLNYIVQAIYEVAWGYKKINGTHYYISNGVGTWGPPIRTSGRPEIVQIRLNFE